MSDSVRPHRRQPLRLPHPWDSPGKNTGVGCHFLLQCMKVKSESEVAESCPTLSNPMDCGPPGSSVHGIFQARVLEWGAIRSALNSALSPDLHCFLSFAVIGPITQFRRQVSNHLLLCKLTPWEVSPSLQETLNNTNSLPKK